MNRLTITLEDDVYAMARSHAIATKTSLSKAIADLMRQRRSDSISSSDSKAGLHPLSGFPVSRGDGSVLTNAEVRRAIDDDLISPMELMDRLPRRLRPR